MTDVALHRKIWKLTGNEELVKLLTHVVGPFHLISNAVLLSPYYRRNAIGMSLQQIFMEWRTMQRVINLSSKRFAARTYPLP